MLLKEKRMKSKNILEISDLSVKDLKKCITRAIYFKKHWKKQFTILKHKRIGLLFDAVSLRTKVSFEVAIHKLGGFPYYVDIGTKTDVDIGSVTHEAGAPRESFEDIVDTMDRFVDAYVVRDYSQQILNVLKRKTFPPVINGFSVTGHPSQALADVSVITLKKGDLQKLTIAVLSPATGSGVIESFIYAVLLLGGAVHIITPTGTFKGKNVDFWETVAALPGRCSVTKYDATLIRKLDVLYVDEWWFPGADFLKKKPPKRYRADANFLHGAKKDLIILHCLPAHHNREISEEVITSERSIVFDEAEFRVYSAMALLEYLAT